DGVVMRYFQPLPLWFSRRAMARFDFMSCSALDNGLLMSAFPDAARWDRIHFLDSFDRFAMLGFERKSRSPGGIAMPSIAAAVDHIMASGVFQPDLHPLRLLCFQHPIRLRGRRPPPWRSDPRNDEI